MQRCIVGYIGGYILNKWRKKHNCGTCAAFLSNSSSPNTFITHKQYKDAIVGLQRPSDMVTSTLMTLECVFMANYASFFCLPSVIHCFMSAATSVSFPHVPCHPEIRDFIFKTFFTLRTHHQCKLLTQSVRQNKHKAQRKSKHIGIIATKLKARFRRTLKICQH